MEFKEREIEFPNRKKITKIEELEDGTIIADIENDVAIEGAVTEEGTPITAAALNNFQFQIDALSAVKADADLSNVTGEPVARKTSVQLWSGAISAVNGTATLSQQYADFKFLVVIGQLETYENFTVLIPTSLIGQIGSGSWGINSPRGSGASSVNRYFAVSFDSQTQVRVSGMANTTIQRIVGLL